MDTLILYLVAGVCLVWSFLKNRQKTGIALRKAFKAFENILPQFLVVFVIVSMALAVLDTRTISLVLGQGFRGLGRSRRFPGRRRHPGPGVCGLSGGRSPVAGRGGSNPDRRLRLQSDDGRGGHPASRNPVLRQARRIPAQSPGLWIFACRSRLCRLGGESMKPLLRRYTAVLTAAAAFIIFLLALPALPGQGPGDHRLSGRDHAAGHPADLSSSSDS